MACLLCARSMVVATLVLAISWIGGTVAAARAIAAPLELVPAYFGPEGSPDPWDTMCEDAPLGSTVILNPDNGPVKREAKVYDEPMRFCEEHGQRVIGYVFTRYGKRSLGAVERAIAHYYSWYPGVEGIFLDEMAEAPTAKVETYYRRLAEYVHERGGVVVGNPGDTAATSWQLGDLDTVVTFEGSAASYTLYSPPAWVLSAHPQQIANIVFGVSEASQMQADCKRAAADNAGFLYITDLPEKPDPYEALPSYWAAETASC
jgi:Spherulation-specific family 4